MIQVILKNTFIASVCYVTPNMCAKLSVNYLTDPPEFNSFSSDVVVVEGDPSVTLECIADGVPTLNITWTKVYANGSDSGVLGTENLFKSLVRQTFLALRQKFKSFYFNNH